MSAEPLETRLKSDAMRSGLLVSVASRLKALEAKFPAVSQSLLSIVDQAIVSGTSFVSAVIIGRMTTVDQLGLYYLVLSITLVATAIQDSAVFAPFLVYSMRRRGRELEEYTGSVWIQLFLLCAISIGLLLTMILALTASGHTAVVPGLWILCIAGPLILIRQGVRRFTFANLHVRTAILLDAIVAAAQLGGLFLLGYLGQLTLVSIFGVIGAACALACVWTYLLDPPRVRVERERLLADWRQNWAFAKWTLRSYLLGYTAPYALLWILGLTTGAAAAGVLGICNTLIGMTNVLVMGVDNVLTPQATHAFTTGGTKALRRILFRTGAFLTTVLGGFCLLVIATGDWLNVLAFGAAGVGSGGILVALALSALMNCICIVSGNGLWAINQPRPNFLADVVCMVVTLIAAAILVGPWAAQGAALATLAGTAAAAVVRTLTLIYLLRGAVADRDARTSRPETEVEEMQAEESHYFVETAEAAV
jgi:O-antigen/teichoic acid export membrane protein